MSLDPRDYQSTSIGNIRTEFANGFRRILLQGVTGSGKGFMIAYMAFHAAAKGLRVYIIVHRGELVDQLSDSLRLFEVRHGRIQPNWPESRWQVQLAIAQTLTRRLDKYPPPDFILFDEAHHVIAPTFQRITDHWPNAKLVGFTATPMRLDGRGLGKVFDAMVVGPPMRQLIDAGWLAEFDYLAPPSRVDMSSVHIRAGDYAIDELAAATNKVTVTGDFVAHLKQHLDRRPTIAFCVRVDHAEAVAAQARDAGIVAVSVDGSLDAAERKARILGLANGNTELLTSCEIVGEGIDLPVVAGAALLRRTKSLAMFLQWCGRVMRPKPDGSRAVILDHVGCVHEHGLPDAPRLWTLDDKRRREAPPPIQTCELCYRVFAGGPNWREGQECARAQPAGCILNPAPAEAAPWTPPEVVPGELQKFTNLPSWGDGIDIIRATGPDWQRLLELADTYAKLDEIRRARAYSPFWVRHIMKARHAAAARRRA